MISAKAAAKHGSAPTGVLVLGPVLIIVLLGYVETVINLSPSDQVAEEMHEIGSASCDYVLANGPLPTVTDNRKFFAALAGDNPARTAYFTLPRRLIAPDGRLLDPWGTPLKIVFSSSNNITIISAGPDHVFGDNDDVSTYIENRVR